MKKQAQSKKLPLKSEQVRTLTRNQLTEVGGGALAADDGAGGSGPTHFISIGIISIQISY